MSHTSTAKVDQKEYLKKYLSGDKTKKKKKKRDKRYDDSDPNRKVRIIDDDASAFNAGDSEDELMLTGEDAPQIVGEYIETATNKNGDNKWHSLTAIKNEVQMKRDYSPQGRWGKRTEHKNVKNEFSPKYRGRDRSTDMSPPRKREKPGNPFKKRTSADLSPTRVRNRGRSQDQSPSRANPFKKTARGRSSSDDLSPVRTKQRGSSNERKRKASSADQSPPRFNPFKQGMRGKSPNFISGSPRRYETTNRISKDLSPPRQNRKYSSSPRRPQQQQQRTRAFSPMRRPNNSISPRGRFNSRDQPQQQQNRFAAKLPMRRRSIDLSPPRKPPQQQQHFSPQRERERDRQQSNYTRPDNRRQNGANNNDRYRSISSGSSNQRRREDSRQRNRSRSFERPGPPRFIHNQRSPERQRNQRFQNQRGPEYYQNQRNRNSPNRRQNQRSPPRRRDSDQSPPRMRQQSERSDSPPSPCIKREKRSPLPYVDRKTQRNASISPPPTHKPKTAKTLDGKKAGLQDAKSLKEELSARRRAEESMFEKMSNELSGRDAEVAVRNTGRHGQRARAAKEEDPEKLRRKEEREKLKKEQYDRWGKGLKQIEDHRARLEEQAHESSKPLARYSNDEDLERHLREQEHADDPMLAYMRRKKKEKQKDSNVPQVPVYQGSYPENRFGIRPGYRWDGVDRSNGYEKKWFDRQNEKHARQEEAYKYSVEDM